MHRRRGMRGRTGVRGRSRDGRCHRRPGGRRRAGCDRRPRRIERRHRQRRTDLQPAWIALHERLRIRVEQRAARARQHARIARLRGRLGKIVEGLARLDRHGERRGRAGFGRRGVACRPGRGGRAECEGRQRATHGARQARLTRKHGNSGHRWLYRHAGARLGFAFGSVKKVAAEMQKRRAERDAFRWSARRKRVVYFTRPDSGRIRPRLPRIGAAPPPRTNPPAYTSQRIRSPCQRNRCKKAPAAQAV